jgi:hypothetical protein
MGGFTMTFEKAFQHLIDNWEKLPKEFRDKYRSYRSKFLAGKITEVGIGKRREMLLASGYKENWKLKV